MKETHHPFSPLALALKTALLPVALTAVTLTVPKHISDEAWQQLCNLAIEALIIFLFEVFFLWNSRRMNRNAINEKISDLTEQISDLTRDIEAGCQASSKALALKAIEELEKERTNLRSQPRS